MSFVSSLGEEYDDISTELSAFVPYTGATSDVNLGSHSIVGQGAIVNETQILGLTPNRVVYPNSSGTLTGNAGFLFDEYSLTAPNYETTYSLGVDKITNGAFPNTSSGWVLDGTNVWTLGYIFYVTGVSTSPTAGAIYTNGGNNYTVRYVSITGTAPNKLGYLWCESASTPSGSSGTLTKSSGTGDSSIAFASYQGPCAMHSGSGTNTLSQASSAMVTPLIAYQHYLLSFEIVRRTVGNAIPSLGGVTLPQCSASGSYTYLVKTTNTDGLVFTPSASAAKFAVDNVTLTATTGNIICGGQIISEAEYGVGADAPSYVSGTTGAASKFFWLPKYGIFRAGYVDNSDWNTENLGYYSVAFGYNGKASAAGAVCIGNSNDSTGQNSLSFGELNFVSGASSVGIGYTNTVSSIYSVGIGYINTVSGNYSLALGSNLTASGTKTICFGDNFSSATDNSFNLGWGQQDFQVKSGQTTFGGGVAGQDYILSFNGETNDGTVTWMEDENYFKSTNKWLFLDKISFTQIDENEYIDSLADGYLDLAATTAIRLKADTILDANKALSLSGSGYVDAPTYKAGGTSPVADATYNVDGSAAGTVSSITTKGGIITAIVTR